MRINKHKKKPMHHWKVSGSVAILWTLCFSLSALSAVDREAQNQAEVSELEVKEAREARRAAEARCAELTSALGQTEKELAGVRRRYATLYLQSRELQQTVHELELQAANMLAPDKGTETAEKLAQAGRALKRLQDSRRELRDRIHAFQVYLNSVLDMLQPSEALRREIAERFNAVLDTVDRYGEPLSSVAGRDSGLEKARQCHVLAVNDDLQIVVLDTGAVNSVRCGSEWRVITDSRSKAVTLRIIETRPYISAAVVAEGSFNTVAPGALAELSE